MLAGYSDSKRRAVSSPVFTKNNNHGWLATVGPTAHTHKLTCSCVSELTYRDTAGYIRERGRNERAKVLTICKPLSLFVKPPRFPSALTASLLPHIQSLSLPALALSSLSSPTLPPSPQWLRGRAAKLPAVAHDGIEGRSIEASAVLCSGGVPPASGRWMWRAACRRCSPRAGGGRAHHHG